MTMEFDTFIQQIIHPLPKDNRIPDCDRDEDDTKITWTTSFSGGWGDGGPLRTITYNKNLDLYESYSLDGWGYHDFSFMDSDKGLHDTQSHDDMEFKTLYGDARNTYDFGVRIYNDTYYTINHVVSKDFKYCVMADWGLDSVSIDLYKLGG